MLSRIVNILLITMLTGVLVVVGYIALNGLMWDAEGIPEKVEVSIKDTTSINVNTSIKDNTLIKNNPLFSAKGNVSLRDSIVDFGMKLLGTPYADGACGIDGFDCSGFVYFVFRHHRIQVPRSSSLFKDFGKEVPINKVKKGDILVFLSPTRNVIGHVGIVTNPNGMETEFIHSTSGHEMKVVISSLKQEGYNRRFVKAVNVLRDL